MDKGKTSDRTHTFRLITKDDIRDYASQFGATQISDELVEQINDHMETQIQRIAETTVSQLDANGTRIAHRDHAAYACALNPNIPSGSY